MGDVLELAADLKNRSEQIVGQQEMVREVVFIC